MSATNFERAAAEAAPVLKDAQPTSVVAVIVLPDGGLLMDPTAHADHGAACLAYAMLSTEHGCQFIGSTPQRFTVTERPDLGERTYHVTRGTDSEIVRLP